MSREVCQFETTQGNHVCRSCRRDEESIAIYCQTCEKGRKGNEIYYTGEFKDEIVCKVCAPEMHMSEAQNCCSKLYKIEAAKA